TFPIPYRSSFGPISALVSPRAVTSSQACPANGCSFARSPKECPQAIPCLGRPPTRKLPGLLPANSPERKTGRSRCPRLALECVRARLSPPNPTLDLPFPHVSHIRPPQPSENSPRGQGLPLPESELVSAACPSVVQTIAYATRLRWRHRSSSARQGQ